MKLRTFSCLVSAALALSLNLFAQSASAPPKDSATFDPDGTAHITRVVPMPPTISAEAQTWLNSLTNSTPGPESLAQRRARTDVWRAQDSAEARKLYPVNVEETTTAGVRTDIITPLSMPADNRNRVLINLHGGGFNSDSGSLIEGVPIANLAKMKVVSVYYRLAPENPFPAAVDDVVAVYKDLLKTYKPKSIGIFGTSAGAILTCEVTVETEAARACRFLARWESFLVSRTSAARRLSAALHAQRISRRLSSQPIRRSLTTASTRPQPTAKIPCCLPCSPICTDCRRACRSRARATFC